MRILWTANIVLPKAAKAIGMTPSVFGGWVEQMIDELSKVDEISLGVAMRSPGVRNLLHKSVDGVEYFYIPICSGNRYNVAEQDCLEVLKEFNPDLLHSEGAEMAYTRTFIANWNGNNVISMQGILNGYAPYEYGSLNLENLFLSFNPWKILFAGALLINKRLVFNRRIKKERRTILLAKNILGRTTWDRAHSFAINRTAPYYHCSRILRPKFYKTIWDPNNFEPYSLFIGNASSPRKGAHFVIQALHLLRNSFPSVKLYIAGPMPYARSFWDWKKKIGYSNYLLHLIRELGLQDRVIFLGVLNEEEMAKRLSSVNVYVMSSIIENSPNTLGEAMIMGVPCVASFNGGVPDMARDEQEALLYRANDAQMLSYQVNRIFSNEELSIKLSHSARKKAMKTHNREANVELLLDAYKSIAKNFE